MSNSGTTADREATKPFSIRLTRTEREALQLKAGTTPLGHYIRDIVLGAAGETRAAPQRMPLKGHEPLGQALALLGQSELGPSLKEMARQAKAGTLYIDGTTRARLGRACADVHEMRVLLLKALGKHILEDAHHEPGDLANAFQAAADTGGEP